MENCTFDWMKANAARVAPWDDSVFEGGGNGRWSETLTPAEIAVYEARAIEELGPECAHWLATGELP